MLQLIQLHIGILPLVAPHHPLLPQVSIHLRPVYWHILNTCRILIRLIVPPSIEAFLSTILTDSHTPHWTPHLEWHRIKVP